MPPKPLIGIVDDDADVPAALSSMVRSLGYRAECFESAEQLLACPSLGDFYCIISDIHMPQMSGLQLVRALDNVAHGLPVILMTGRMESGLKERAVASGAISIVAKPFVFDDISSTLERAAQSRA